MTGVVLTPCGLPVLFDEIDQPLIELSDWRAQRRQRADGYYVYGRLGGRKVYLHRLLLGAIKGQFVDHINRDGLDNRRGNLRLCTQSQNAANQRVILRANKHGFRGVSFDRRFGKYRGVVCFEHRRHRGPWRESPCEAAIDYDRLAAEYQGEFAIKNFAAVSIARNGGGRL